MRTQNEVLNEMALYDVDPETIQQEIERLENELSKYFTRGCAEDE